MILTVKGFEKECSLHAGLGNEGFLQEDVSEEQVRFTLLQKRKWITSGKRKCCQPKGKDGSAFSE